MAKKTHGEGCHYTETEINLVLQILIDSENKVAPTLAKLERIAADPDDEAQPIAKSVIDWVNGSKQRPRNRVIYDLRRVHYNRMLEILHEGKGVARMIKIIDEAEANNAEKTIEFLHNVTRGKPVQEVKVTGFIKHSTVQQAVEASIAETPDGEWVNPELSCPDKSDEPDSESQPDESDEPDSESQ